MKSLILVLSCLLCFTSFTRAKPCPCSDANQCLPVSTWSTGKMESIVTTAHISSYQSWMWNSITTVLEEVNSTDHRPDLMCYAHAKNVKFGFIAKVPLTSDATDETVSTFTESLKTDVVNRFADVVALDFIDLVGNCDNAEIHVSNITTIIQTIINSTKKANTKVKVICIMPWKPPCFESKCHLASSLVSYCDAVLTSPDSFASFCEYSCMARATVPYHMMLTGVEEWLSSGFTAEQVIIGIPWHGYQYNCTNITLIGDGNKVLCNMTVMDKTTNKTTCNIQSRVKVQLGSFFNKHAEQMVVSKFDRDDQEPFYLGKNQSQLIWYEDTGSLIAKYSAAKKMKLKGVAVYTADDLTYSTIKDQGSDGHFNQEMWSWLLMSVLSSGEHTVKRTEYNVAGTVAGVGVGMFIFGCLLGMILTCIALRKKKNLRAPFRKDTMQDEFRDDEDNAL